MTIEFKIRFQVISKGKWNKDREKKTTIFLIENYRWCINQRIRI